MKDEELILKAVDYCNDIPARVKDFLRETKPSIKEEPKIEFKVGQWVTWDGCHKAIGRIVKHCNSYKDSWSLDIDGELNTHDSCNEDNLRHATQKEIEDHLIKVAKEKGYTIKTKIICLLFPNRGQFVLGGNFSYILEYDRLIDQTANNEHFVPVLYHDGKWAEIIPTKKKLPCSNKEAECLIADFCRYIDRTSLADCSDEFLKDYED